MATCCLGNMRSTPRDHEHLAEIVACYGDSVLDVRHLGPGRHAARRAAPWLGLGGLLLAGGSSLFAYEATRDFASFAEAERAAQNQAELAPPAPGMGTGGLGLGLALLGLVPLVIGGYRLSDRRRADYSIGESPEADLTVLGPDVHGLVRRTANGCRLELLEGMIGEIVRDGRRSVVPGDGPRTVDLPAGARASLRLGSLAFHVAPVNGAAAPKTRPEIDYPFLAYFGGTGIAAISLFTLARLVPEDAMAVELGDDARRQAFVNAMFMPNEQVEEEEAIDASDSGEARGGEPGQRAAGEEGAAGKPTAKKTHGRMAVKGPKDAIPRIGRNVDPEMLARTAGILGVIETADAHAFLAQGGSVFSSTVGNEHEDVWGQLVGDEVGEAYGVGGLGLVGTSRGGGGEASGVIGLSHTGFLGTKGVGGKGGLSYGDTGGTTFGGRKERRPVVRVAHGEIEGALDKDIVRRVVRAHINEVRSCYNAGLTKNPNLGGRVLVQFVIGGNGKVHTSVVGESSVDDPGVGQCVAKAVRRWQFPKPHAGGQVFVSYPFVLDVA